MAEEQDVRVTQWPEGPARLVHQGDPESAVGLRVGFEPDAPAAVVLRTEPERQLDVRMAMLLAAERPVPLCITVCEPICVTSEYRIGVEIFDRPVMSITVRGTTRFAGCDGEVVK
jgi:hypothetical protein